MKLFEQVSLPDVISHFEKVEKITIPPHRMDIVLPLTTYSDLNWYVAEIQKDDVKKIYICSSDDWKADGLCVPDFKLSTAIENYSQNLKTDGKYLNIKEKEDIYSRDINGLDTKFILVAMDQNGPFTLIEGCKRSVALGNLNKLEGIRVYVGLSPAIKGYIWARYMF